MANKLFSLSLLAVACLTAISVKAESFSFDNQLNPKAATLVMFQHQGTAPYSIETLPKVSREHIQKAGAIADFTGQQGEQLEILAPVGLPSDRLLVIGLGEDALTKAEINQLGGQLVAKINHLPEQNVGLITNGMAAGGKFAAQFAHGVELKSYRYTRYKQADTEVKHYYFATDNVAEAKKLHSQMRAIEAGVFLARDITNAIPNDLYPASFALEAKKLRRLGVKIRIIDRKNLQKLGMGALLGVGQGSKHEPMLVVAQWQGSDDAPIALVGKGITFDSGGYNIKTDAASIVRMKADMAGAATVLGTLKAMAIQKAPVNLLGVMPLAENMVSEQSLHPGDVLKTAQGLTVEVTNTDAEGRLILADALWYARAFYKPKMIVDVATLTGAKVQALGYEYAGLFSDNLLMVDQLTFAGQQVGEKLWRLPLDKAYAEELKSDLADLKNTGKTAGASVAAMFLKQFVADTPWAHLDIAGNAMTIEGTDTAPIGATGYGVRLLSYWLTENDK